MSAVEAASSIVTNFAGDVRLIPEALAEVAVNREAFSSVVDALDVVAEIAAAVHEADRWLATGEGRSLPAIRDDIAEKVERLDQLRASAWALADRPAARPVALVLGGAS